jgi:hypothetical protein
VAMGGVDAWKTPQLLTPALRTVTGTVSGASSFVAVALFSQYSEYCQPNPDWSWCLYPPYTMWNPLESGCISSETSVSVAVAAPVIAPEPEAYFLATKRLSLLRPNISYFLKARYLECPVKSRVM